MHDALRSRSSPLHPDRRKRPGSAHRAHGPHQSGGRGSAGAEVDWSEWSPRRIRASVRTLPVTVPCQCLSERTPHMWSILTSHSAKGYQSTPRSRSQTAHQAAGLRAARDVLEPEESDQPEACSSMTAIMPHCRRPPPVRRRPRAGTVATSARTRGRHRAGRRARAHRRRQQPPREREPGALALVTKPDKPDGIGVDRLDRMPPPRGRWHPTGRAPEPATRSGSADRRR